MTLKTEQGVLSVHPAAIIAYRDETGTSASILDPKPGSSRIQAVLDKFLNQRSRSLDYLSGRNLACYDVWKETNFAHFAIIVPHLRKRYSKKPTESFASAKAETFQGFSGALI
jgi:hypothetical protein